MSPQQHTVQPARQASPTKSSLLSSYRTNAYNDEDEYDTPPRNTARRPKSVTFDKQGPEIQEFELVTPEPSIDGSPGDNRDDYSDFSDDDDEVTSDEEYDLDSAPVMEPEGWTRITPETMPAHVADDSFRSTPSPNGGRPLPPLPGILPNRADSASPNGARPLPTVPLDLRHTGRLSLEDRMSLMNIHQPDEHPRRASSEEPLSPSFESRDIHIKEEESISSPVVGKSDEDEIAEEHQEHVSDASSSTPEPTERNTEPETATTEPTTFQMSRNIIRRQLEERRDDCEEIEHIPEAPQSTQPTDEETKYTFARPQFRNSPRSSPRNSDIVIKQEDTSDEEDMYAIPKFNPTIPPRPISRFGAREPDVEPEPSEASTYNDADDEESHYEDVKLERQPSFDQESDRYSDATPRGSPAPQRSIMDGPILKPTDSPRTSLPDFSSVLGDRNLSTELALPDSGKTTPRPEDHPEVEHQASRNSSMASMIRGPSPAPSDQMSYMDDDDTGSVIRHHIETDSEEEYTSDEYYDEDEDDDTATEGRRSPSPVPDTAATIRAPNGLKTRASATPADIQAMAAARRHVSGDVSIAPPVPRMPLGYRSEGEPSDDSTESELDDIASLGEEDHSDGEALNRRRSNRMKMPALPVLGEFEFDLKLDDLNDEFEKVIEKQKRGYLMRQNTRVIHASSRDIDDEPTELEPLKPGHSRGKSWSVEPWRAAGRRRSHRDLNSSSRKRSSNIGPTPPLPGQESAVSRRLPSVSESEGRASLASGDLETGERGRLFVKVVGVKDLALPLPQGQPAYFCLTLDNGLHCVTTSWLELAKNAPIGQEFEL